MRRQVAVDAHVLVSVPLNHAAQRPALPNAIARRPHATMRLR